MDEVWQVWVTLLDVEQDWEGALDSYLQVSCKSDALINNTLDNMDVRPNSSTLLDPTSHIKNALIGNDGQVDWITWKGQLTSPQFLLFLLVGKHTSLEDSGSDFHDLPAPELPKVVIFSTWKGWEVGLGVRNSTGKCMIYI